MSTNYTIDKKSLFNYISNELIGDLICGICLTIAVRPVVTPCCRHMYCDQCIKNWLQNYGRNTCPLDRRPLTVQELTAPPIFIINILNVLLNKGMYI